MVHIYRIRVEVVEVMGVCHAGFRKGDKIVVSRPRIDLKETDKICIYALQSMIPFIVAKSSEIVPSMSLDRKSRDPILDITHIRCPDPGVCYGGGSGSVIFKIIREGQGGRSDGLNGRSMKGRKRPQKEVSRGKGR